MFEAKARLAQSEFNAVENLIFESEGMEHWNLYENFDDRGYWIQGVFESEGEAEKGRTELESRIEIGTEWVIAELEDRDWKESYKEHFKPWSIGNLHWAPIWLKEDYQLSEGEEAVWLDPGMAFGTGNHDTTRLCVERLIDFKESQAEIEASQVLDAGCGSGILAISAAKLGFKEVEGFDIDEDAVRIAEENAALNRVSNVAFRTCGLEEGLKGRRVNCLLANILANILVANSNILERAVASGGWLILSGILETEANQVAEHFSKGGDWREVRTDQRGEWASVTLVKGEG